MPRNSLGKQVMSLLGVALFTTLIIFSLSVFYSVNRTESEAWRSRQKESARNAAGAVGGFIQRVEDALRVVSIVEPDHLVLDSGELDALLEENTALLEIVRVDSSGRVFASAFRDRSVLASLITIPQSQWFLQAKAGHTFLGDLQLSANNAPYLIMAVPSTEQGVVAARVEMGVLWNVVQNIQFGETGEIIVINRAGNIIAHTDPDFAISRQTLQGRPELQAMLRAPNSDWFGEYTNFHDEPVVGVTTSVPGTDWIMITELARSEAFADSKLAIFVLSFEAFILMLAVSLMVARYVRLQIVMPMDQLRDGADRIGQGELGHRIGLVRRDEIGQLAKAFDAMADQLLNREIRLAEQTQATFASEARYRAIVEDQTELICRFQPDGTLTFVNEAYCRYFQKQREELIGRSFMPLIPDEDRLLVEAQFASLNIAHPVVTYEHRVILPGGELRWQHWTDRALFDPAGVIMEYASVGRDITERKLAQDALRNSEANLRVLNIELEKRVQERTAALQESEERYMLAVNGANDGLWDWNLKTGEIYFSPRWKTMLGYQEAEIGSDPEGWFQRIAAEDLPNVRSALSAHLNGDADHFESEYRILDVKKQYRWMLCRGLAVRDAEGIAYRLAGSQTDITDRKLVEERLAHDALHDALTGLPNRTLFLDRLGQRLEHSKRHKDDLFAILFLDMDRFKVINDSLGHAMGDKFLVATSQRLESCLRPEDTISRLGGDEFAILLGEITDVSDAIRVTERIQSRLQGTTLLGSIHRSSSASIGITIFNGKYTDPQEMLRDADSAMYRAKSQGGGRYQVFNEEMFKNALTLLQLEADLKSAVERQEWQVFYQPVIHLASGEVAGVEALVRWRHPKRGLISPVEFIPVAEESGLIIHIGEYVLREACRQVKIWRETSHPRLWVSVNLSGRQFQDQDLLNKVTQILDETGVSGDSLRLEVTETVAMKDFEYSVKILRMLETLGIHLSLDDFGNGYSSLSYLKRFPIKSLKIDRSFIRDIEMNKNSEAITSAIISLGHNLNLEVVAEGVETEEQFAFLKAQICDDIQGFLFSRPLPAGELEEVLNKNPPQHLKMPGLELEKTGR